MTENCLILSSQPLVVMPTKVCANNGNGTAAPGGDRFVPMGLPVTLPVTHALSLGPNAFAGAKPKTSEAAN